MVKRIFFVRHGITRDNTECVFSGSRNPELEVAGYVQAEQAAKTLVVQPDVIISSPKQRALTTAWTIAEYFGMPRRAVVSDPLLRERSYGDLEGTFHLKLDETLDEVERQVRDKGAEPLQALYERQKQFYEKLKASSFMDNLTVLAVGHAAAGRALLRVARGLPFDGTVESIPNATPLEIWAEVTPEVH